MAKKKSNGGNANTPKKEEKQLVMLKNARGKEYHFVMDHALALLRKQAPASKGWVISDKNWTFDGHEIHRRQGDTGNNQES